jgi:hypothetical protein
MDLRSKELERPDILCSKKKKTMLTYPPAISRLYWLSMIDRFLMQMESMIVPLLKQPVLPEMEGYRDD